MQLLLQSIQVMLSLLTHNKLVLLTVLTANFGFGIHLKAVGFLSGQA